MQIGGRLLRACDASPRVKWFFPVAPFLFGNTRCSCLRLSIGVDTLVSFRQVSGCASVAAIITMTLSGVRCRA